jgi:Glycosyl hydrolases family 16
MAPTTLKLTTDKTEYAPGEEVIVTAEYSDAASAYTVEVTGTVTNPDNDSDTAKGTAKFTVQPTMPVALSDNSGDTYTEMSNVGGTAVFTTTAPALAPPAPTPPPTPPPAPAPTPIPAPSGSYILDENFTGAEGTLPDSGTWTIINEPGAPNFGSNDAEYYVNDPAIIYQDGSPEGNLIIKVGQQGTSGASGNTWPSGRCDTSNSHAVQVNQSCEVRALVTNVASSGGGEAGSWPAIWFQGVNSQYASTSGDTAWTEIDMLEAGDPNPETQVTIWGGNASNGPPLGTSPYFNCNDGQYHTYRLDYLPGKIEIYIDGKLFYSLTSADAASGGGAWEFSNNGGVFVIINVAINTQQYGTPQTSELPAQVLAVDYVRIWEPAGPDPVTAAVC